MNTDFTMLPLGKCRVFKRADEEIMYNDIIVGLDMI